MFPKNVSERAFFVKERKEGKFIADEINLPVTSKDEQLGHRQC